MNIYKNKYIKYKNKYLQLKNSGGNKIPSFELYSYNIEDIKEGTTSSFPNLYKVTLKSNEKNVNSDLTINLNQKQYNRLLEVVENKNLIYQIEKQKNRPVENGQINYYSIADHKYKKYKKNVDEYSKVFKKKPDLYSFTKMFPDYLFLFQKIIEADKQEFIDFCKEVHKINIERDEIKIITPGDINDLKLNNELVINGVKILFNRDNLYGKFNTFEKLEEKPSISDNIKLIYQFKEMLKDYSMSYKLDFETRKKLFSWGFKPTDVFYNFIIFFQELDRIKELSEDSKKNSSIIEIEIKKENRQKLIKNIDNIRKYFFKEYSKDFEDKSELLDNMYVVDYIIYKMGVVYNDIVEKLIKGGVYSYIMSIIDGFKKLKTTSIFEEYLNKIKSYKEKKQVNVYIPPHLRTKAIKISTLQSPKNKTFVENANLFVDNVCPMELIISIRQIEYNNEYCTEDKNYKPPFYFKFNETNIPNVFINRHKKISELKLKNRPLILGVLEIARSFRSCAKSYIYNPWGFEKYNKKLSWNITLNKWMVSCLLKRKQDIKCIIVHRNNEDDKRHIKMITDFDKKYENKLIAVFPRFNKREEKLNLEMKNFIGSMIFNVNGNKKHIFMFNNKGKIKFYNLRASVMYSKNIVIESLSVSYIELTTLIYFKEDMGVDLYFYLYKYNEGDDDIIILVKGNKLTEEITDYIEVELIIDRSKNNSILILLK